MKIYLVIFLALLATGCSSDDPTENNLPTENDPLQGLPDNGALRFDNPEVGQRSRYIFFIATTDDVTKTVTLHYYPDTLVLAITGNESNKWVIKEFLTNGSKEGNWRSFANEEIVRHLTIDKDSAYFSRPANAFFFSYLFLGDSRKIPLQVVNDPAPLNVDCMPFFGIKADIWVQYSTDYKLHGQFFSHLNEYFDYTPMTTDGHGFMWAYGAPYGIVRWTWVNPWDYSKAQGWDLIPD